MLHGTYRCENCRQPFQTLGSMNVHRRYCPAAMEMSSSRETVASSSSSGLETYSIDSSDHQPSRDFSNVSSILQSLSLSENPMSAVGELTDTLICRLAGEERMQDVKRLWIVDAGLSQIRSSQHLNVRGMSGLVELNLTNNYIQGLGDIVILPSIRVLRLDHNQLSSVAGIQNLHKLEAFSVTHNAISSIHNFPLFPQLQELLFAHNQLTSEFDARTALQKQPNLTIASVEGNPFMLRGSHIRYRLLHSLHLTWLDSEEVTPLDYSISLSVQIGIVDPGQHLTQKSVKLAKMLIREVLTDTVFASQIDRMKGKVKVEFEETMLKLARKVLKRHNL